MRINLIQMNSAYFYRVARMKHTRPSRLKTGGIARPTRFHPTRAGCGYLKGSGQMLEEVCGVVEVTH